MYFARIIGILAMAAAATALNLPPPPPTHHHRSVDATTHVGDNLNIHWDSFCWCFFEDINDIDYYETSTCCDVANGTYADKNSCHFDRLYKQNSFQACCRIPNDKLVCHKTPNKAALASDLNLPPPAPHDDRSVATTAQVRRADNINITETFCWCTHEGTIAQDKVNTTNCCQVANGRYDNNIGVCDLDVWAKQNTFDACCTLSDELHVCAGKESVVSNINLPPPPPPPHHHHSVPAAITVRQAGKTRGNICLCAQKSSTVIEKANTASCCQAAEGVLVGNICGGFNGTEAAFTQCCVESTGFLEQTESPYLGLCAPSPFESEELRRDDTTTTA